MKPMSDPSGNSSGGLSPAFEATLKTLVGDALNYFASIHAASISLTKSSGGR